MNNKKPIPNLDILPFYHKMVTNYDCVPVSAVNQIAIMLELKKIDIQSGFLPLLILKKKILFNRGLPPSTPLKACSPEETYKAAKDLKWIKKFIPINFTPLNIKSALKRKSPILVTLSSHAVLIVSFIDGYFYVIDPRNGLKRKIRNPDKITSAYIIN